MNPSRIPLVMTTFFISFFLVAKESLADYRNYCQWGMGYGMMGGFGFLLMIIFWIVDRCFNRPVDPPAAFFRPYQNFESASRGLGPGNPQEKICPRRN